MPSIKSSRTRIRKRMSMYFTNSETCRNLCKSVRQTSPAYTDIKFLLAIFLPPISLVKSYHKHEKCTYLLLIRLAPTAVCQELKFLNRWKYIKEYKMYFHQMVFSSEIVFSLSAKVDNVICKYSTQYLGIEINIDRYYWSNSLYCLFI